MAKTKDKKGKESKSKNSTDKSKEPRQKLPPDFLHEIWGIIFMAVGILVTVSLVSFLVDRDDNILGKFLGTDLSAGLIFLFGPLPAFLIPTAVLSVGWQRLRGRPLRWRTYAFWTLVTLEVCTLLAIHNLPQANNANFIFADNCFGNSVTYFLHFVFGPHRFGPYFLFSLALLITALIGLRIPFKALITTAKPLFVAIGAWFAEIFHELLKHDEPQPPPLEEDEPEEVALEETLPEAEEPVAKKNKSSAKKEMVNPFLSKGALTAGAVVSSTKAAELDQPEPFDDAPATETSPLDKELAEFRAKKSLPIKITTPEELAAEQNSEPEPDPDLDEVQEVAFVNALKEVDKDKGGKKGNATSGAAGALHTQDQDVDPAPGEIPIEPIPDDYYKVAVAVAAPAAATLKTPDKPYVIPSADTLPEPPAYSAFIDRDAIERNSRILEKTLLNFGVEGKVSNVSPGPVITRYEIELAPGVKVSRVVSIQDDIAIAVGGQKIRILPHIPGKAAIGIELPNDNRQMVYFKHILQSEAYTKSKAKLPVVIGRSTSGAPFVTDIAKMPHLLIAGQTGAGKSVCINSFLCSLLMARSPQELRMIMIDPKKVELSYYEGVPHLLSKVVTEPKEAVKALRWGEIEMERRYRMFARAAARNIESFNEKLSSGKLTTEIMNEAGNRPMPMIVIVVDELADLMITAPRDVETSIQRIAQLARAVGIHLIVATQRPSVDVITGRIKANLTSRISFRTIQSTDSRTILEHVGAEKLLGQGDMLFLRSGAPDIERFHGAYTSEQDVETVVEEIRKQAWETDRIESFAAEVGGDDEDDGSDELADGERDPLFAEAARVIVSIGQGSTSLLQRRMKIGYARAGRIMDELERAGFVGPQEGSKMREVRIKPMELEEMLKEAGM